MKTFGEKYMMFMICIAIIHWLGSLATNEILWVMLEPGAGLALLFVILFVPTWYFFVFIGTLGFFYLFFWFFKESTFRQIGRK